MRKVLLTFTNISWQKGSAAQVFTFVREMRRLDKDIEFTLLSHCYELDNQSACDLRIHVTGIHFDPAETTTMRSVRLLVMRLKIILWVVLNKMGINFRSLVNNPIAEAYIETDMIADLSGDSYRDRPGGVSIAHNVNVIAAKMLKKPIVLVSQSIGPFKWYSRPLSRYALNLVDLIYIREKLTLSILRELRLKSKIVLAPDVAFLLGRYNAEKLLEIYKKEEISKDDCNKRLIGISTSGLMYSLSEKKHHYDYMDSMIRLIDHLHKTYHAIVVLIPHEIKPACMGIDDRFVSLKLAEELHYPSWLKVIKYDYDPSEIKTLISSLDGLIAARMHAGIAGLSSNIPTVLLSWSHKYLGMVEDIGIPQCIWDGDFDTLEELKNLFDTVMNDKEAIKRTLTRYNSLSEASIQLQLHAILRILKSSELSRNQAA